MSYTIIDFLLQLVALMKHWWFIKLWTISVYISFSCAKCSVIVFQEQNRIWTLQDNFACSSSRLRRNGTVTTLPCHQPLLGDCRIRQMQMTAGSPGCKTTQVGRESTQVRGCPSTEYTWIVMWGLENHSRWSRTVVSLPWVVLSHLGLSD